MLLKISAAAAALVAATAIAGAASAQDQAAPAPADQAAPPAAAAPADTSAPAVAAPAPASDSAGYNVGTPQTDPNTGAQMVTNGPVPDTRANRQRFGMPDSHAGKRTAAAGN